MRSASERVMMEQNHPMNVRGQNAAMWKEMTK